MMERLRGSGRLWERERDLALIEDALARASGGSGRLVVIDGPAGIGKTRLIERSAELAASAGFRLFTATGHELEQDLPFGVVRQLLERELPATGDPRRDTLFSGAAGLSASVFASGALPEGEADGTYGLLHGIHWLVVNLAVEAPLALLVDDVQWADELSLRAMAYLRHRLDGLPVAFVVAARPAPQDGARREILRSLSCGRDVVTVSPRPLSAAGTAALVGAIAPRATDDDAVAAIHEVTGGNPFLIVEAVRSLSDEGETITLASVATLADSASESLSNATMLRLGALGPEAIAVSRAVAVLDVDSDLAQVCALSQLERAEVLAATRLLVDARILADEAPLRFAHPLLRAAVYGDLPELERACSHERAAAVLERFAADNARIAAHLLLSRPAGNDRFALRLRQVAEDATAKGDHVTAARYWRRALAEPPAPGERPHVLLGVGLSELADENAAVAIGHLRAALDLLEGSADRLRAALGLGQATLIAEGFERAVDALDTSHDGLDEDALLRLDVERTGIAFFVPALAGDAARRMRSFSELEGRTLSQRLALASAALACAFDPASSAADVTAIATRAIREDTIAADWAAASMQICPATGVLHYCEEFDAGERALAGALDSARARGSGSAFAIASLFLSQIAVLQGRLAESIAHTEAVVATAADLPRTQGFDRFFLAAPAVQLAWALVERGEIDRATRVIDEAAGDAEIETPERCPLLYGRGLVRFASGNDHRGALDDFIRYGAISAQMGYEERILPWRLHGAQASAALGDRERAVALAEDALAIARVWGAPGGLGAARRVAALVGARTQGDRCEQLELAVATLRSSHWRLELARALVDLGIARRVAGHRVDSRSVLREGLDLAAACGARPLVQRARSELLIAGARPRRDRITGRDALTPSEQRIAGLACAGNTNREIAQLLFVTPKTVELHLSRAYRKLGIAGRSMLAQALANADRQD
jgi:DNA-binding CsgD family transcriptional regulator